MTPARRTAGTAARAARRRSWTWGSYEYLNTNGILGAPEPPAAGSPAPEPSGTAYIAFTYDALGRRIERTVDSGGASVEVTRYYYDGQNVLVETDADEAPRRSFVHGSQYIDERVLMRLPNGAEYYYLPRELYSVAALTDEDGAIVEAATYDTYGQVAVYDGSAQAVDDSPVGNPYYFTGRRLDLLPTASGPQPITKQLYHYRARAYDPGNGRFVQRDPLEHVDGPNVYAYVQNNPPRWPDPLGLQCQPVSMPENCTYRWDDEWKEWGTCMEDRNSKWCCCKPKKCLWSGDLSWSSGFTIILSLGEIEGEIDLETTDACGVVHIFRADLASHYSVSNIGGGAMGAGIGIGGDIDIEPFEAPCEQQPVRSTGQIKLAPSVTANIPFQPWIPTAGWVSTKLTLRPIEEWDTDFLPSVNGIGLAFVGAFDFKLENTRLTHGCPRYARCDP